MHNAPPSAVVSVVLGLVLIGILVGFQIPAAKSAPAPEPARPVHASTHGDATGKADPRVKRGEVLYQQYCSTCHGADGKGDGISATNLPIKPQNLTEGAVVNPLPDSFLHRVISQGAQSVGLSPLMPGFTPYL